MKFYAQDLGAWGRWQTWETLPGQLPGGLIAGAFEVDISALGSGFSVYVRDQLDSDRTLAHRHVHPMERRDLLDLAEELYHHVLAERVTP